MSEEDCSICGLKLLDKYSHNLQCNHIFHYECLMKTFIRSKMYKSNTNSCPYCRETCGYLPIVNGLKKIFIGVHVSNAKELISMIDHKNTPCQFILTRGKNKGNQCSKNCFLGYDYCKVHKKSMKL